MKSKEFWKMIAELFNDKKLSRVENGERWKKAEMTIRIKSIL